MEYRGPKVTGTVIERYFIRTYFRKTRPLYKVLHQNILFQGWNWICASERICIRGSNKFRVSRTKRLKVWVWQFLGRNAPTTNFFISISTVYLLEKSIYSFVREAATVRWAIGKFRNYFWGSEFMLLSYCSVLKIFESEPNVPHVVHRWRDELLQ